MDDMESYKALQVEKFQKFIREADGGIFTSKTRRRLVGELGMSGRGLTKNDFWYDQRNRVRNALTDLEIFLTVAGRDNVNQVLTVETMEPVIKALFALEVIDSVQPDPQKAWIAYLLIYAGFEYLSRLKEDHMTEPHKRTLNEAISLAQYLADIFELDSLRQK